ncbi:hypothetical protein PROFUN_16141 [Planoprotostelium fungivorum]|uniref:Uncharacterized protein n=1 Tax=Planoprotostelium fungivorum TaxID=1890364 RepID=A0A2P6MT52_9EUKA|nr:hypothetical protein PROFUN_16141 [Planoprotostelium fungivorum]
MRNDAKRLHLTDRTNHYTGLTSSTNCDSSYLRFFGSGVCKTCASRAKDKPQMHGHTNQKNKSTGRFYSSFTLTVFLRQLPSSDYTEYLRLCREVGRFWRETVIGVKLFVKTRGLAAL